MYGNVDEGASGEANNQTVDDTTISITPPLRPDITVENLTVTPSTGVLFDSFVTLRFALANRGEAPAGFFSGTQTAWLSTDAVLDAADRQVAFGYQSVNGLAVDGSIQSSLGFWLPLSNSLDTGDWFLILETDSGLRESDETNNTAAVALRITAPPAPDLRVLTVEAPTEIQTYVDFEVRWVTVNEGPGIVILAQEQVWLSDASGTVPERLLSASNHIGRLAQGEQSESSVRLQFDADVPSGRRIMVVTDATQTHVERAGEDDNVTGAPNTTRVAQRVLPDLMVSDIDAPTSAPNGRPLTFSYTVTNIGGGPTVASRRVDEIWFGGESTSPPLRLTENVVFDGLAAGESRTYTVTVDIPANIESPRALVVKTNTSGHDYEADRRANNETRDDMRTAFSTPPLPDLVPESIRILTEGPFRYGQTIEVEWTVRNIGGTAADGDGRPDNDWTDSLSVVQRETGFESGVWVRRDGDPVPGPDGRYTLRGEIPLEVFDATLPFEIRVVVGGAMRETNKDNNAISIPIDLGIDNFQFVIGPEGFTGTRSGFVLNFGREIDASRLTLYGPDPTVWVTRSDASGENARPVRGNLVIPATGPVDQIQFVATGGVLQPGYYTFHVTGSGPNGVVDLDGNALDGDSSGEPGGDFFYVIDWGTDAPLTFGLPDTMRGPGQALGTAAHPDGLRMSLSNGDGITSVLLNVRYDANQIDIDEWIPREGVSISVSPVFAGVVQLTLTTEEPLPAGRIDDLVTLRGRVRDDAVYGSVGAIEIEIVSINNSSMYWAGDRAVVVTGFVGDTTGNARYSTLDAQRLARVVSKLDPAFAAWPLVDPVIVGDINGSGTLTSTDFSRLMQFVSGRPVPQIPPIQVPAARSTSLDDLRVAMAAASLDGTSSVNWSGSFGDGTGSSTDDSRTKSGRRSSR